MTGKETAELLGMLRSAYPRQKIGAATLTAYTAMLVDLDVAAAKAACAEHMASSQWFPTIAEIRTRVAEVAAGVPTFDAAWGEVSGLVQSCGYVEVPTFSHPAITATVAAFGWETLCKDANQSTVRAQFRDMYATRRGRQITEANVTPLLEASGLKRLGATSIGDAVKRLTEGNDDD